MSHAAATMVSKNRYIINVIRICCLIYKSITNLSHLQNSLIHLASFYSRCFVRLSQLIQKGIKFIICKGSSVQNKIFCHRFIRTIEYFIVQSKSTTNHSFRLGTVSILRNAEITAPPCWSIAGISNWHIL